MSTETAITGKVYTTTGDSRRGEVHSYHYKPSPLFLNKTKHRIDIAGLKTAEQRTAIQWDGTDYESRFTVGFEIEKNQLHRGAVREYELFCGFERDGSCGYEAVTHILPLLPNGKWKTKVFDMVLKAEKIIDDRYSPSDKRCGGHITIACDDLRGNQLREAVRKNAGVILALFRKRLNNVYCGANRRLEAEYSGSNYNSASSFHYNNNGWHGKYQTALVKGNCLEFRVPSKFESVKQTMRRYELFYELVNFSVNNPNGSHETFLKKITPIIVSMYNGDKAKADEILKLARHFQKFILKGTISPEIQGFL
jgi:hypothetical protein